MNNNLWQRAYDRGVYNSFIDDHGRPVDVAPEAVEAVLAVLGDDRLSGRILPPVVVAWDGALPAVTMSRPVGPVELRREDGGAQTVRTDADGTGGVRTEPITVPLGYHALAPAGTDETALVIAAPTVARRRRDDERHWGLFIPAYALRSSRSQGVGDLTDLRMLADWLARRGGDTVLALPLLPQFLDRPAEPSPYSPISRLFWNELYADLSLLPEADDPAVADLLGGQDMARTVTDLLGAPHVDYERAAALKHDVLARAATALANTPTRRADLDRFIQSRPEVVDYARFRAVGAQRGRNWQAWPDRLARGELGPTDADPALVDLHVYAQFVLHEQLAALTADLDATGRFLGLDLALGTHRDGYDVWRNRDLFVDDASAGAPPDGFFTGGQDWGFPPLHPEMARLRGHDYFIASVRHHLRSARLLRIDHVMGLHRLYWVPNGRAATEGTYVAYPADELFAIVCLEAQRAGAHLIGENLGTVPAEVNEALARHQMLGTYVAQAHVDDLGLGPAMDQPDGGEVATVNTHDMPTFAGWWAGHDITDRVDLDLLTPAGGDAERTHRVELRHALARFLEVPPERHDDPDTVLAALLVWLAAGPEPFLIASLEDLWLEDQPQNVPGTYRERPNWVRPARYRLDELDHIAGLDELLARIDRARRQGR